jgi:hypothetical protein
MEFKQENKYGPGECGLLLTNGERCTRCYNHPDDCGVWILTAQTPNGDKSYRLKIVPQEKFNGSR